MDLPPPPKGTHHLIVGLICGIVCAVGALDLYYGGNVSVDVPMVLLSGLGFIWNEVNRRRISARTITQLK